MSNFKNHIKKNGFTIVELVIVIAVISILAAAAVPTFASVVRKAKISAMSQLASSFNKAIVTYEALDMPISTMHDVIGALEDYGYDEQDVIEEEDNFCVVWDRDENRFVVFDKKEGVVCDDDESDTPLTALWQVVTQIPEEQTTNLYLADAFTSDTVSVEVGLDVGDNDEVKKIIYTDTDQVEKEIIIRVNNPDTEVDLSNKGNDEVTVIGLDNTSSEEPDAPEDTDQPTDTEKPEDTENTDNNGDGEDDDNPEEFDPSKIVVQEGKVVYSVANGEQYNSLDNAMTIGGELILLDNVNECSIEVKGDVVLDLNGFSVGYGIEQSDNTIIIDGGSLTVKDSSADKLGAILNNGAYDGSVAAIRIKNSGSFTLESGTVSSTKCAIYCENEAIVNINGGTVSGVGTVGMGIYVLDNVALTINDGYIATESAQRYPISINEGTLGYVVTINGGLIEGTIAHRGEGSLIINAGIVQGTNAAVMMRNGKLEINGGDLSTNLTDVKSKGYLPKASIDSLERVGAVIHVDAKVKTSADAIPSYINITGGNFISKNFHVICITGGINSSEINSVINLTVTGGIFTGKEGYETIISLNKVMGDITIKEDIGVTILKK